MTKMTNMHMIELMAAVSEALAEMSKDNPSDINLGVAAMHVEEARRGFVRYVGGQRHEARGGYEPYANSEWYLGVMRDAAAHFKSMADKQDLDHSCAGEMVMIHLEHAEEYATSLLEMRKKSNALEKEGAV